MRVKCVHENVELSRNRREMGSESIFDLEAAIATVFFNIPDH